MPNRQVIHAYPQNVRTFRIIADRLAAYRGSTAETDNQRLELVLEYMLKARFDSDPTPRANTGWGAFTTLAPLHIRGHYARMIDALAAAHDLSPDRFIEIVAGELFAGQRRGDTVQPFLRPAEIARQHTGPRDRNTSAIVADFAANGVAHPPQPSGAVLKDFVGIDTRRQIVEIKRAYPDVDDEWIRIQGINAIYWTLYPGAPIEELDEPDAQAAAIRAAGYHDLTTAQLYAIAVDTLYQEVVGEDYRPR
jgi:hypothetical protein